MHVKDFVVFMTKILTFGHQFDSLVNRVFWGPRETCFWLSTNEWSFYPKYYCPKVQQGDGIIMLWKASGISLRRCNHEKSTAYSDFVIPKHQTTAWKKKLGLEHQWTFQTDIKLAKKGLMDNNVNVLECWALILICGESWKHK